MAEATAQAATPQRSRKTIRGLARRKKKQKLKTDKEFAKAFFEGKSKRSADKKSSYRKKKKGKK